jgi:hypothetical protein
MVTVANVRPKKAQAYTVLNLMLVRAALTDKVVPHVHGGGQDQHVAAGWTEYHEDGTTQWMQVVGL